MEILNTHDNWKIATRNVLNNRDSQINAIISEDDYLTTDITMFRYYFPLARWYYEHNNQSVLSLVARVEGEKRFCSGMVFRILEFTRLLKAEPYVDIVVSWGSSIRRISDAKIPATSRTGKMYPLCAVAENPSFLLEPSDTVDNKPHQQAIIGSIRDELIDFIKTEENYTGKQGQILTAKVKESLKCQLMDYFRTYSSSIGLLSQTIWLYFLRTMLASKQLFDFSNEDFVCLRKDLLAKSLLDATAYGEGTYQLIENACLHSTFKTAWFGFRIHDVQSKESIKNIVRSSKVKIALIDRFAECFDEGEILNPEANFYIEIFVLDATDFGRGIVPTYNEANHTTEELIQKIIDRAADQTNPTKHIRDLTVHYGLRMLHRIIRCSGGWMKCLSPNGSGYNELNGKGETVENKDLCSIGTEWSILLPAICFWKESPNVVPQESVIRCDEITQKVDNVIRIPWYSLRRTDVGQKEKEVRILSAYIFEQLGLKLKDDETVRIDGETAAIISTSIILIEVNTNNLHEIEVLAKAVFSSIAALRFSPPNTASENEMPIRIALLFSNDTSMLAFVRVFTAFYINEEQNDMNNVEIALCVEDQMSHLHYVRSVLKGSRLSDAYLVARRFSYSGSDGACSDLPLFRYLAIADDVIHDLPIYSNIFPFDLFLTDHTIPAHTEISSRSLARRIDLQHCLNDNWFVRQVKLILERDMQEKLFGCKVNDIHIRLGSKLHLDCFYEAELVFHDPENVYKFTYMMALDILYGAMILPEDSHLLLVGYEKYSSALTLSLKERLMHAHRYKWVKSAIAAYDEKGVLRLQMNDALEKHDITGTVNVISLLPVGSTLSTVYKMHKSTKQYFAEKLDETQAENLDFSKNYSLIVVNEALTKAAVSLDEVTSRYWSNLDDNNQIITTKPEFGGGHTLNVRYFIPLAAKWHAPENCAICNRHGNDIRPVIDAKQSETMAGAIFYLNGKKTPEYPKMYRESDRQRRFDTLFGNLTCAHIYEESNHYQFYIDFARYFAENKETIEIEMQKKWQLDEDAYYVVVAPQQSSNFEFVNAVLKNVFHNKTRFLYLNLSDGFREELRTKFSYIADDFRRLRTTDPNAKIHICFADATIVTGSTINRAKVIMKTLLEQSEINYQDVVLFHKVFLLVNRCSYNTMCSFVLDPKEDFYEYIYSFIPSYNTENDFCPACKLKKRYELLEKRSSTDLMSKVFHRRTERMMKRTPKEYERWIDEEILTNPTYFNWLRRWLYINMASGGSHELRNYCEEGIDSWYINYARQHISSEEKEILNAQNDDDKRKSLIAFSKKRFCEIASYLLRTFSKFYEVCESIENASNGNESTEEQRNDHPNKEYYKMCVEHKQYTLSDLISFENALDLLSRPDLGYPNYTFQRMLVDFIKIHLLASHDYMRAKSMDLLYQQLETVKQKGSRSNKYLAYQTMLEMIEAQMKAVPKSGTGDKEYVLAKNIEWIVSFIKVLSREHLANYYHFRQGISAVMEQFWLLLLRDGSQKCSAEGKNYLNKCSKIKQTINAVRNTDSVLCGQLHYYLMTVLFQQRASLRTAKTLDTTDLFSLLQACGRARYQQKKQIEKFKKAGEDNDEAKQLKACFSPFPGKAEIVEAYLKAAMNAAISTDDDSLSITMAKSFQKVYAQIASGSFYELSMREELEGCCKYLYLENTRIIYAGLREMESRFSPQENEKLSQFRPAERFADYTETLNQIVNQRLVECFSNFDDVGKPDDILFQNRLGSFCRFWDMSYAPIKAPKHIDLPKGTCSEINPITYLLQYYRCLNRIEEAQVVNADELPYLYEELCRIMCGLTDSKMCYIAYSNDCGYPEVFAQSGYYIPYLKDNRILSTEKIDSLTQLARFAWNTETGILSENSVHEETKTRNQEKLEVCAVVDGVAFLTDLETDTQCIVIQIPLNRGNTGNSNFYITLQGEKRIAVTANQLYLLKLARSILCMRQKLKDALSNDYTVLLNFRFDCSYIRPISEKQQSLAIIHISDLHATNSMKRDIDIIKRKILSNTKTIRADILAVTGDVADCVDASAPVLEENYRTAEEILREVAICLWCESRSSNNGSVHTDDSYLPHDWRRRILITTGNHDYASMNQYKASLSYRSLSSGAPIESESGTMSKFAYFIDFLIRFLDPPIDELIRHDLNEVRHYRNLNLKVLLLNCSGKAMPHRTNKMAINSEVARDLLIRQIWKSNNFKMQYEKQGFVQKPFRLCLAHYSPKYELSYFNDSYSKLAGWTWEPLQQKLNPINQLIRLYQYSVCKQLSYNGINWEEVFEAESKTYEKEGIECAFQNAYNDFKKALEAVEEGKTGENGNIQKYISVWDEDKTILSDEEKRIELIDKIRTNATYRDMSMFADWLRARSSLRDQECCNDEHIARIIRNVTDRVRMSWIDMKSFTSFIDDHVKGYDLYLAGHIHSYAEAKDKNVLVSDKLISDAGNHVCGYVITNVNGGRIVREADRENSAVVFEKATYSAQRFT